MTALQGIGLPLPNHYASPCRNPFPLVATETPPSTVVWLAWLRPVAGTAAGLSLISIRKPVDHRVGTWQRAAGSRSPTPLAALFARKPTPAEMLQCSAPRLRAMSEFSNCRPTRVFEAVVPALNVRRVPAGAPMRSRGAGYPVDDSAGPKRCSFHQTFTALPTRPQSSSGAAIMEEC